MTREQFISQVEGTQGAFRRFLAALCCGDMPLADDIAQESYMKAWLSIDSLKDQSRFRSWLFRISYTSFIDHRRRLREHVDYEEALGVGALERADDAFRYQSLYDALDKLPPRERMSLLLYYMEGYQVKEIAGIVEASPDAVRQQLSRGRSHLRDLLSH